VEIDLNPVLAILTGMEAERRTEGRSVDRTDLIPLLQKIQKSFGYLPVPALLLLSRKTGIPTSRMHGVITFYAQFHTQPRGRHTVRCCQGTACHVKGGKRIAEAISQALGIEDGGTSGDMRFTFETVACLGTCFLAPVIMINDDYYGNLTPDKIPGILEAYT
jgi:NADH-quinone oxidoreductase subunit E